MFAMLKTHYISSAMCNSAGHRFMSANSGTAVEPESHEKYKVSTDKESFGSHSGYLF